VQVEIWSDVVCPWCAVGRARFERALAGFAHADEVELRWRSFELDPSAPRVREEDQVSHLAAKYGRTREQAQEMLDQMTATAADEGLTFRFDVSRPGNTFDAHRLLHLAHEVGAAEDRASAVQDRVKGRFLEGYLAEGAAIGEVAALRDLATDAGLPLDEIDDVLAGDRYAAEVRTDEEQARAFGISAVPFFVLDRRYGIAGAQPSELLLEALDRAWAERSPLAVLTGHAHGDGCTDGGCAT
jgi:predicted DsbA family dithiol-disulfide isomerase